MMGVQMGGEQGKEFRNFVNGEYFSSFSQLAETGKRRLSEDGFSSFFEKNKLIQFFSLARSLLETAIFLRTKGADANSSTRKIPSLVV